MGYSVILVVSHRHSGTHWMIDSLRSNFLDVEYQFYNLDEISRNHQHYIPVSEFTKKISKASRRLILKSHMTAQLTPFGSSEREFVKELLKSNKVIYVYRDGRDVLVSLYYYMLKFRNDLPQFSDFIRMKNDFDCYYSSMNRIEYWKEHVVGWISKSDLDIIMVSYEQLHSDYEDMIRKLSDFLSLPLKSNGIDRIELKKYGIFRRALKRLLPTSARSSAILPRKGIVGDWKNYFSECDLELFKQTAGDLMKELGYY